LMETQISNGIKRIYRLYTTHKTALSKLRFDRASVLRPHPFLARKMTTRQGEIGVPEYSRQMPGLT
jgi:hypothetical protein